MGKLLKKLGLGLVIGAAAGHYLSTDKGQKFAARVKEGLSAYQANPDHYQAQAKAFLQDHLQRFKELVQEEVTSTEQPSSVTAAEVDDIVITYTEDDLS